MIRNEPFVGEASKLVRNHADERDLEVSGPPLIRMNATALGGGCLFGIGIGLNQPAGFLLGVTGGAAVLLAILAIYSVVHYWTIWRPIAKNRAVTRKQRLPRVDFELRSFAQPYVFGPAKSVKISG